MVWCRAGVRGDFLSVYTDFFYEPRTLENLQNPHALYHVLCVCHFLFVKSIHYFNKFIRQYFVCKFNYFCRYLFIKSRCDTAWYTSYCITVSTNRNCKSNCTFKIITFKKCNYRLWNWTLTTYIKFISRTNFV